MALFITATCFVLRTHARRLFSKTNYVSFECAGRLGNQLFEYSAAIDIAKRYPRMQVCMICSDFHHWQGIVPRPVQCDPDLVRHDPVVKETGFAIYDNAFMTRINNGRGFRISQFLQSYKYLQLVGQAFTFEKHIKQKVQRYLAQWSTHNMVGFHVRRTDMLSEPSYRIQVPSDFYRRAIAFFQERYGTNYLIVVVSDDLDWCKKQVVFQQANVVLAEEFTEPTESLALLANCVHHVITIGTFGWWGAWLGTRRESITLYHNEFNISHPDRQHVVRLDDYYPPSWIEFKV